MTGTAYGTTSALKPESCTHWCGNCQASHSTSGYLQVDSADGVTVSSATTTTTASTSGDAFPVYTFPTWPINEERRRKSLLEAAKEDRCKDCGETDCWILHESNKKSNQCPYYDPASGECGCDTSPSNVARLRELYDPKTFAVFMKRHGLNDLTFNIIFTKPKEETMSQLDPHLNDVLDDAQSAEDTAIRYAQRLENEAFQHQIQNQVKTALAHRIREQRSVSHVEHESPMPIPIPDDNPVGGSDA